MGAAGDSLATSIVAAGACGTQSGGWMTALPPPRGQLVDRTVCFSSGGNSCMRSQTVSVVTCNGFYLYRLVGLAATCLRYCSAFAPNTTTTVAPTGSTTPSTFNAQCSAPYKLLTSGTRAVSFNDGNYGRWFRSLLFVAPSSYFFNIGMYI